MVLTVDSLIIFQFQSRCHFKMGGSASEGEWQEALCVFEKGKMELHLKKCRLEVSLTR